MKTEIINLLLLNNFYPVIYRPVQRESDVLLYTVWSLVMVRNQLPAQVVEIDEKQGTIFLETLDTNVIIFVSIPNIR